MSGTGLASDEDAICLCAATMQRNVRGTHAGLYRRSVTNPGLYRRSVSQVAHWNMGPRYLAGTWTLQTNLNFTPYSQTLKLRPQTSHFEASSLDPRP
eukprot:3501150-Rhodomonas_salina.1